MMKVSRTFSSLFQHWAVVDSKFQRLSPLFISYKYNQHVAPETKENKELASRERLHFQRPNVQKWKRPPFVKNLFLGKFDTVLLAFPEVLSTENLHEMECSVSEISKFFQDKVNSEQIDIERKISPEVLQNLKDMGLFGRLIPQQYGGLGLTHTEYTRLNEAVSLDWSIGILLAAHEFGVQALLHYGNESQKLKYLPDLASGKKTAAFCFHETQSGSDAMGIQTKTVFLAEDQKYVLSGTKAWVTNAENADVFIVFAKEEQLAIQDMERHTVFLVDKNTDGVKISTCSDTTAVCGSRVGMVQFDEVVLSEENKLGTSGHGIYILNKLNAESRFGTGTMTFGVLKSLLNNITEYVIDAERNEKSLSSFELIKKRLVEVVQKIYAMESVSYFTAALHDTTEGSEFILENAIVKVFNSEGTVFCLEQLKNILGCLSLRKQQGLERFYRNAQALSIFESSNDIARFQIGLTGCQSSGANDAKLIEKYRNPFYFPYEQVLLKWRNFLIQRNKFKYNQDIAGHLHPSLVAPGNRLEECVQQLELATQIVLIRYGKNVMEVQIDPQRLADLVINLYVRTAVLSRSSRSYCIGLKNTHEEIKLAILFCAEAQNEFMRTYTEILKGCYTNNDDRYISLGGNIIDRRGFFPEHPLKYNY